MTLGKPLTMSPTISHRIQFYEVTFIFVLWIFLLFLASPGLHFSQQVAWSGVQGSCLSLSYDRFFSSDDLRGSGLRLQPLWGYPAWRRFTRSGPHRLRYDIQSFLWSASGRAWGWDICLQKTPKTIDVCSFAVFLHSFQAPTEILDAKIEWWSFWMTYVAVYSVLTLPEWLLQPPMCSKYL